MRRYVSPVLSVLALVVVGLVVAGIARGPSVDPVPQRRPVLVLSGDALSGSEDPFLRALGRPGQLLQHAGAGFTGPTGLAQAVLTDVTQPGQAAVVVQGGEADTARTADYLRIEVEQMVDRLRVRVSPTTALVVVGPVPSAAPTPSLLAVRDGIALACRRKAVHFVDPVRLGVRQGQADLGARLGQAVQAVIPPAA